MAKAQQKDAVEFTVGHLKAQALGNERTAFRGPVTQVGELSFSMNAEFKGDSRW